MLQCCNTESLRSLRAIFTFYGKRVKMPLQGILCDFGAYRRSQRVNRLLAPRDRCGYTLELELETPKDHLGWVGARFCRSAPRAESASVGHATFRYPTSVPDIHGSGMLTQPKLKQGLGSILTQRFCTETTALVAHQASRQQRTGLKYELNLPSPVICQGAACETRQ